MSGRLLILTAAAVGGPTATALIVLIALGDAAPGPAIAALVLVLLAAAALSALWVTDLRTLSRLLREEPAKPARPLLPPTVTLLAELNRLARDHAARTDHAASQLRSDEAIVERLPDPLIVLDATRAPRRANAAARAAFGADLAAVLRHPLLRAAIERAWSTGTPQRAALSLPVPIPRELDAAVLHLGADAAPDCHAVVVLSDRTRERAIERMRADFVANASHELRTPLASLIGFIDTLRGPAADDPPAQTRFLTIMAEQAARMRRLIDDLLGLSRIELVEHQAPSERVDLAQLIPRIAAGFEPRLAARRMDLQMTVPEALAPVLGDADQLAQVLQNLLDNAVNYGKEGGAVRLSVRLPDGANWPARPGLVIAVSDNGIGIPANQIPRLTERFYRVDKARSRSAGGTGLGLAIVKHIVSRHRGQLLIESEEGKGSTFSVWLPVAADTAAPHHAISSPA